LPERVSRIVPVGTIGKAISLRVQSLQVNSFKVVKQIETPRLPDPIMRRPRADREEKRVTHANETTSTGSSEQEQLDCNHPNQRRLLGLHRAPGLHFPKLRRPRRMPKQSKSNRAIATHW